MCEISPDKLLERLDSCGNGAKHWNEFETICIEILGYLFVPPLQPARIQSRTLSGVERRDAIFPNRNTTPDINWGFLYKELNARMILFEFKNYSKTEIGHEEVNQVKDYLRKSWGKLAFLCSNKIPNQSANKIRNTIFSETQVVILFLQKNHLKEMVYIMQRGEDPSDLIMDLLDSFYLQHE